MPLKHALISNDVSEMHAIRQRITPRKRQNHGTAARVAQRLLVEERNSFELFQRAIHQQDHRAWELVFERIKGLLLYWLSQHPCAHLALEQDSPESYVNGALEKFWHATDCTGTKPTFSTQAEILAYLQRCLNSVVLDAIRQAKMRQLEVIKEEVLQRVIFHPPNTSLKELWECVEQALPDHRERLLIYLRYIQSYRPRELVARYPRVFESANEVYRLERNILQRLRRHPCFASWGSEDVHGFPVTHSTEGRG